MEQGAVFQSNRGQVILLPRAVAFPEDVKRVDVVTLGRTKIITPVGESWDGWFDRKDVTPDFMVQREQPADEEREAF